MSRSCQSATFSSADEGVRAQDAGQAADALRDDRVSLVRHGRGALLARGERLERLAHLRALEVADLEREPLERRSDAGDRAQERGVAVAGDDLGRHRLAVEAERPRAPTPRPGGRCWRRRRRRPRACRRGRRRARPRAGPGRGGAPSASRAASTRTWSARRARRACARWSGRAAAPRPGEAARRRPRRPRRAGSGRRRRAGARGRCRRRRTRSGRSGTSGRARPPARRPTP